MTQHEEALESFIGKWRARWPEWRIAEVFVPASQRVTALAWFALLQELTDAAWSGNDPTPGLAKLAWWQEELQGWSQGRRRHPLGTVLQSQPAPWTGLAHALPGLRNLRVLPQDIGDSFAGLRSFAESAVAIEANLFDDDPLRGNLSLGSELIAASLLALHPGVLGGAHDALRESLSSQWPAPLAPRARRIVAALARARLARHLSQPLSQGRVLWIAWRAARH